MATHTETANYKLETTRNALFAVLTRKADGADVTFQDDAAAAIVAMADAFDEFPPHRHDELADWIFSQYDDVMQKR